MRRAWLHGWNRKNGKGGLHSQAATVPAPVKDSFDHTWFEDWKKQRLEDALQRLDEFESLHSNVYALLLRKCGAAKDLRAGRHVHLRIQERNPCADETFLANLVVEMYGKCASVTDALVVFDGISVKNVFSWTMMMAAYSQNGHYREALELFTRMQWEGTRPDKVVFVIALDACAASGELDHGRQIHSSVVDSGLTSNIIISNSLVNMYGKCQDVPCAEKVFDGMLLRDVVSWTAMLAVYAQNGCWSQALQCLSRMDAEGVKPNQVTFVTIVDVCAKLRLLDLGRKIHHRIINEGLEPDGILGNALVHMYGSCGSFDDMKSVFSRMGQSSVLLWTTMIAGCSQNGQYEEGLLVFRKMDLEGVKANEVTYMSMVEVCRNLDAVKEGEMIDARILESPFCSSTLLATSLISLYGQCGILDRAKGLLEHMYQRDVVAWNAMVTACAQNGDNWEAIHLLRRMDMEGFGANKVTYLSVLEACANLEALSQGREIHARVLLCGLLQREVAVGNSVITMYGKCGQTEAAMSVFEAMPRKDDVSWNAVINASVGNSKFQDALELFHGMELEGLRSNEFTLLSLLEACGGLEDLKLARQIHARAAAGGFGGNSTAVGNSVVNMYARCGSLLDTKKAFDSLEEKGLVAWSIMLAAYAQSKDGSGRRAFKFFQEMEAEGIKPGEVTFVSALDACAAMATLEHGRSMHRRAAASGFVETSLVLGNTIINMYGKCGSPSDAKLVFDQMPEKCLISWNSLIVAYAHNGHALEALSSLQEMLLQGFDPDSGTSVSILYGLSHAGLLERGVEHFRSSIQDHGLEPSSGQLKCLVDLLARKGFLDAAEELILASPACQADTIAWMTLLAACKSYGDPQRGIRCAERVFELEPQHSGSFVVLANLYASVGRWSDASRIRKMMERMSVKKEPGCSWIELSGSVHEFISGESKHPKIREICEELEKLTLRMREAGYVPDTTNVVHDVEEGDKEEILSRHSERLAIVFGLMSTRPGETIRVVKNLRVCSDCHAATKIISSVVGREIVVRDSSRFHHFKHGQCSCGDFW
ncbi:pentatricopeptide repeat-containing protein At3g24000, mitochondrial [Selaginella moellendorffii]|uniref:pentatricopeptide repeat-containing protein At3g24000, mitochondrial n=1 Tax=Selaginella moellendorffii TaxID=88036 RepID=UPI000D1CD4D4|nr:pentatricopeptide repeat-containing protein At3g24000, mitochondrial [Selaginella moellendorffii]|eukprot:XP_024521457.1 pentatricopeptide repeat-containing protein At3g24000, mitochondrial [Selaginella moellendorffii]